MLGLCTGLCALSLATSLVQVPSYRSANGEQTACRSRGRWVGAIRLPDSVRNLLGTESICADAAGMLFALRYLCLRRIINGAEVHKLLCRLFIRYTCRRSSTVVSVTYLDDLILSFVGGLVTMLGTCATRGKNYISLIRIYQAASSCRYKKTIICQEVAKAKNVCQVSRFATPSACVQA